MESTATEFIKYVANFLKVTVPIGITIGLVIAIVTMMYIGIRFITHKNAQERAVVIENFKWAILGIIGLGIVTPIISYLIFNFFK